MLQCVLQFLTEFVSVLRSYTKDFFRQVQVLCVQTKWGFEWGVWKDFSQNILPSENEVLFLHCYFLEFKINLYILHHSALLSSPLCNDLVGLKPSAVLPGSQKPLQH